MISASPFRFIPSWPKWLDAPSARLGFDGWLVFCLFALLVVGSVMIASASMDIASKNNGTPYFYIVRHSLFSVIALIAFAVALAIPSDSWLRFSGVILILSLLALLLVFIPGLGREVNGASRWINLGFLNLQVSELTKIGMVIYISGYLVRRLEDVRNTWSGAMKPAIPLLLYIFLLILQPDYGATVVIICTVFGMIFLGGMRLLQLILLVSSGVLMLGILAIAQPYRVQRLQTFLDPWADPFGAGYQLSQAQIAFGRGEWFGTGLGNSIQKLFYLPEAHTDFIFSILAEELGLIGALTVIVLYAVLIARMLLIGRKAEKVKHFFMAYVCYGFAFIIGGQALINIGVNIGALPTKGLTLPILSYGGSSLMASFIMLGIVLRIDQELRIQPNNKNEKNTAQDGIDRPRRALT